MRLIEDYAGQRYRTGLAFCQKHRERSEAFSRYHTNRRGTIFTSVFRNW